MPSPDQPPPRGSWFSIVLAVGLGVFLVVGLGALMAGMIDAPLVAALVVVGIVAAVFLMPALHYLVWGWWLSKLIRKEVETEEREADAPQD